MRKAYTSLLILTSLLLSGCGDNKYVMNENTFFLVMTNIQFYPEEYVDKELTFDCFTYQLTSITGEEYLCVVRKCSSGFGCKCGEDTIIGFIVNKDLGLPEPKNQYDDTNDKSWVHIVGELKTTEKTQFEIYNKNQEPEPVQFLTIQVNDFSIIEDYSNLHYYVDK
jgi:uncharacterized membrane protein YcgQ (UPF0703/DUF1980 family)